MSALLESAERSLRAGSVTWRETPAVEVVRKIKGRYFDGTCGDEPWSIACITFDATLVARDAPAGTRGADAGLFGADGTTEHLSAELSALAGGQAEASIDSANAPKASLDLALLGRIVDEIPTPAEAAARARKLAAEKAVSPTKAKPRKALAPSPAAKAKAKAKKKA